ncbi:putative Histidine kinase [Candidatus Terasakiella magnetica]|nr:putative Histidine kinase [Candidatus Terasakiella magnetica]
MTSLDVNAKLLAEVERLKTRLNKVAEEKSYLQLVLHLIEHLNPLSGLEDMIGSMLKSIGETIGGTNIKLYYWTDSELHYADLRGDTRIVPEIDDAMVAQVVERPEFIEGRSENKDTLLQGDILPGAWNWAFPLLVGKELIGVVKLENLHLSGAAWCDYLPIFFSHAALVLSNETRYRARLKAEEKLTRWGHIFEHAGWGVVVGGGDGKFLEMMNPAFARMHGFEMDELVGRPITAIFTPEEQLRLPDIIHQAHDKGHVTVESFHRRKDGSIFPVLIDITAVKSDAGQVRYHIVNVQDISQIKETEERLLKSVDALSQSNVELERFAFIASHDLQEPLRTLVAYSQLLERRHLGDLTGDAKDFLGFIIAAANRMHRLVLDLLAYSRVSNQGRPLALIDVRRVVDAACDNLQASIQEGDAIIEIGVLPKVLADEMQLLDIFQNLIGNAIKFHRIGARPEIKVGAEQRGTEWVLFVADNGIGIEQEYLEKIFIIFQRLHPNTTYPGTGIGLAVCKRIVERHGGRIWVESIPGKGSTFFFTLRT